MITEINTLIPDTNEDVGSYTQYCAELARDMQMPLNLIATVPPFADHVPSDPFHQEVPMVPVKILDERRKKKEQRLKETIQALSHTWRRIYKQVRYGFTEDQLIDIEREHRPYLWTLKKENTYAELNMLIDSTQISAIKQASAPVLAIPMGESYKRPNRIVLLHNQYGDKLNIKAIRKLQQRLKFKIHLLLDLSQSKDAIRDALAIELRAQEELKIEKLSILPSKDILNALRKAVDSINPDWMAIQQFDRSPWDRLLSDYSFNRLFKSQQRPSLIIA